MITPPESLVERAWKRGLEVGRYKAVDDTLAHSVEAYSGMPQLFFTWVGAADKRVQFEFLDNSVDARGTPAHRRVRLERRAQRARRHVHARRRALPPRQRRRHRRPSRCTATAALLAPEKNTGFLAAVRRPLSRSQFRRPGRPAASISAWSRGAPVWIDRELFDDVVADPDTRVGLRAAAPSAFDRALPAADEPRYLRALAGAERVHTLGAWGSPG